MCIAELMTGADSYADDKRVVRNFAFYRSVQGMPVEPRRLSYKATTIAIAAMQINACLAGCRVGAVPSIPLQPLWRRPVLSGRPEVA